MPGKLTREEILDVTDNLKDVFRYGPWWQRLVIVGLPIALILGILWIRPLPQEIPEKLKFLDESMNAYFVSPSILCRQLSPFHTCGKLFNVIG